MAKKMHSCVTPKPAGYVPIEREKVGRLGVYSLFHKIKKKIRVPIRGLQDWVTIELYDNSFRIIILRRAGSDCCCLVHHHR